MGPSISNYLSEPPLVDSTHVTLADENTNTTLHLPIMSISGNYDNVAMQKAPPGDQMCN